MSQTSMTPGCDLLVISPHTDDAEIGLGGTLALLADQGKSVWAVDLTQGELGSNATPDERWAEAEAASAVLGLTGRAQLQLPDGFISSHDQDQVLTVVSVLRSLRPRWVLTCPDAVRHPDHKETPKLVERAVFLSRLTNLSSETPGLRIWTGGQVWPEPAAAWAADTLGRVCADHESPSLIFDISSTWDTKKSALACFKSQFSREDGRKATHINDASFLEKIVRRAETWGRKADVDFGEAVITTAVPVLDSLPVRRWL